MPILEEVNQNDPAYTFASYESEWLNLAAASMLTFTGYSDSAFSINMEWAVDEKHEIIHTDTAVVGAMDSYTMIQPGKTRFVRFSITGLTPPSILRTNGFFYINMPPEEEAVVTTLSDTGSASLIIDGTGPTLEIRSLQSSDASISITENANTIDFVNAGGGAAIFQEVSSVINTITATEVSMHVGLNNTVPTNCKSSFCFGENNSLEDSSKNVFVQGLSNSFAVGAGGQNISASGTLHSESCVLDISGSGTPCTNSTIIASISSELEGDGGVSRGVCQCAIIACDTCYCGGQNLNPRKAFNSAIIAGKNNEIGGYGDDGVNQCVIIGGENHYLGTTSAATGRGQTGCSIIAGIDGTIGPSNDVRNNCCLINPNNCQITGPVDNSTIIGTNLSCTHDGNILISDAAGGTSLSSIGNNRFDVRCSGGSSFYSNIFNTTGVSLAAGSSSWAAVCDVNRKENLILCNSDEILDKVNLLPVYCYNYIGNRIEQKEIGTTAQDWHTHFGSAMVSDPKIHSETKEYILDEEGKNVMGEPYPAKDNLKIEYMDMIGALLCSVQSLTKKIENLTDRIDILER